jgi:hypothetical protein
MDNIMAMMPLDVEPGGEPKHRYHAEALLLQGHLRRPVERKIEEAFVSLRGARDQHLVRHAGPYDAAGLVSFRSGYSRASGSHSEQHGWVTVATAVLEGLNVLDVITADRVVAQVATEHLHFDGRVPSVTFLGTRFENLRIGGFPVEPKLNLGICSPKPTNDRAYPEDPAFLDRVERHYKDIADNLDLLPSHLRQEYDRELRHINELKQHHKDNRERYESKLKFTLAERVSALPIGKSFGNILQIPDFGIISLAAVEIWHAWSEEFGVTTSFVLNMLDVKMGSIAEGTLDVAKTTVNGGTSPPTLGAQTSADTTLTDFGDSPRYEDMVYDTQANEYLNKGAQGAEITEPAPPSVSSDLDQNLSKVAPAERRPQEETTNQETFRLLQGNLFKLVEGRDVLERRGLELGSSYKLDVFVAPPGEGSIEADGAFPDQELDWQAKDSYALQVIFAEPDQWREPMTGTLSMPRRGRSSACRFAFSPTSAGAFSGRLTLCYRGRVLQTALLNAMVVSRPTDWSQMKDTPTLRFAVEAVVRRNLKELDGRRQFDASLVLNHTPKQQGTATAVSEHGAFINSLDGILPQLAVLNEILSQVALNSKAYSRGLFTRRNAKLLCELAQEGNLLYRHIVLDCIDRSPAAADLRDAEYLQIVSAKPDALVPLEFIYEYAPPTPDAPVCKNALKALNDGKCPSTCVPKTSPAEHVCPLGFWGLSRVIERHVHDPQLAREAKVEGDGAEPQEDSNTLARRGASLLAASKQVPLTSQSQLQKCMQKSWQGTVTAVSKWTQWQATVRENQPVLLLALPHADGTGSKLSLEISGDVIQSIFIDSRYVCPNSKVPPIVLLLGCDVVNVASTEAYARNIAIFREANAAIVLGTVATVLGADAANIAGKLVTKLSDTAKVSGVRFGEILRRTKREAVAESVMMAMCLVAFGDADWYLK